MGSKRRGGVSWGIFGIVFGVNEVTLSYTVRILTAKRIQRGMGSVARRLDLYRAHLAATSDKEIYLVGVFFILRPCMVVYIIATCHQHLCHQILIDIAKVGCQLVAQQFLINDVLRKILVPKSKRHEESRIGCVYTVFYVSPRSLSTKIKISPKSFAFKKFSEHRICALHPWLRAQSAFLYSRYSPSSFCGMVLGECMLMMVICRLSS